MIIYGLLMAACDNKSPSSQSAGIRYLNLRWEFLVRLLLQPLVLFVGDNAMPRKSNKYRVKLLKSDIDETKVQVTQNRHSI